MMVLAWMCVRAGVCSVQEHVCFELSYRTRFSCLLKWWHSPSGSHTETAPTHLIRANGIMEVTMWKPLALQMRVDRGIQFFGTTGQLPTRLARSTLPRLAGASEAFEPRAFGGALLQTARPFRFAALRFGQKKELRPSRGQTAHFSLRPKTVARDSVPHKGIRSVQRSQCTTASRVVDRVCPALGKCASNGLLMHT